MRFQRCLSFCICWITISTIIICLLFTNEYIFESVEIFFSTSSPSCNTSDHDGGNISRSEFKSHIPDYYPYLPIHIYTQNLTSMRNTTKLILLANGFFGNANWGLNSIGKSSKELSKNELQINY
jgi:hypothetical protein